MPLCWLASIGVVRRFWLGLGHPEAVPCELDIFMPLSLEVHTGVGVITHYGLKTGNRFLLMRDVVIIVLYTCPAIRPFPLIHPKLSRMLELKPPKYYYSSRAYLRLPVFQQKLWRSGVRDEGLKRKQGLAGCENYVAAEGGSELSNVPFSHCYLGSRPWYLCLWEVSIDSGNDESHYPPPDIRHIGAIPYPPPPQRNLLK